MAFEGELLVELHRGEGAVAASIRSTRPLAASRTFIGRRPEQLLDHLPLLYVICGQAQQAAALAALEDAAGQRPDPATAAAREMLVLAETAREHAWRVLLDWPAFLGEAPNPRGLAALMNLSKRLPALLFRGGKGFVPEAETLAEADVLTGFIGELEAALEAAVFAIPPTAFLQMEDEEQLLRWRRATGTPPARMLAEIAALGWGGLGERPLVPLPDMDRTALELRLGGPEAEGFVAAPDWEGVPRETTPRARFASHPLLDGPEMSGLRGRHLALLLELASVPRRMRGLLGCFEGAGLRGEPPSSRGIGETAAGIGLGVVEAARGRLVHRVALEDGVIRDYRILAPTEWNFHPRGAAAQALRRLSPEADSITLERQALLLVHAIDPCVGCRVTVD